MTVSDEDETRILEKATHIEASLTVLSRKQSLDEDVYCSDREQRAIVEREFHTTIEACIDIAGILIAASDKPMPKTNAGRFKTLEKIEICSSKTTEQMQKAAGFRNILAHNYGDSIDHAVVYQHLQNELQWIVTFLREIRIAIEDEDPARDDPRD